MPKLDNDPKLPSITKLLLIGDSGTGKTGSLASLVEMGYQVRILDMDNKVANGILPQILKQRCPDKINSVDYESLRDQFKSSALGYIADGIPKAYTTALALLDKWSDGTLPKDWGAKTVLVVDSLTFFADAAFNWAKSMNPSAKDPRQWFYTAQSGVEHTLAVLTSAAFNANVIVISHVSYMDRPDGMTKGYPSSIGKALGPTIPAYFDNMAECRIVGGKRVIQTVPTAMLDLKNPVSFKPEMAPTFPIEDGLARFFKALRS